MSVDLAKLCNPQVREALLMAEVAAWLHDIRKAGFSQNDFAGHLGPWVETRDVQSIHIDNEPLQKWLLAQSHGVGHFEKENPDQNIQSQFVSTSFGYEIFQSGLPLNSEGRDWLNEINSGQNDRALAEKTKKLLEKVYADGRLPINEISLWSWAEVVGALYRSSLANAVLRGKVLAEPGLERVALQKARDKAEALYQRSDVQQDRELWGRTEEIRDALKSGEWSTSSEELLTTLHKIKTFLALGLTPVNPLSRKHWNDLRDALNSLSEDLQCISGLLAWRLLSIRTDGLGYLLNAPSIPDMLARRDLLTDAWDQVQDLLEETYPLGLEVYRDENGGLFVVPDVENITSELVDVATGKTLRQLILEAFDEGTVQNDRCLRVNGEIVPEVYSDPQPWNGQPPNGLPPVGEHLRRNPPLMSDPGVVADSWCGQQEQICTVCGLRPQGPSEKAKKRGVCDVCESRRDDRAEKWVGGIHLSHEERSQQNKPETIWLDEVADANGRLALLVGQFDLEHWLDGSLARTLAVRKPNDTNGHAADVAKNPSFARIRRIWETTKRFWEEITDGLGKLVGQAGPRLAIDGTSLPPDDKRRLGDYHAYELVLGNVKVAIIWEPKQKRFITAENLVYIARQLGHTVNDHQEAARIVLQHIKGTLTIEEPVGYGGRNKKWGTITIDDRDDPAGPARQGASPLRPDGDASPLRPDGDASPLRPYRYDPTIPILAEPRTFMALVPADRALDVVQAIKIKYEREMGKVRNRLPLHLGIVYADAHMPLRAVLDAGRRMLEQRMPPESWRVVCSAKRALGDGDPLPDRFEADQAGQFRRWVEVTLEREGRRITWYVPAMMGDGQTEDNWYPYVFIESLAPNGHTRSRRFEVPNPWTGQDGTLVHVAELRPDDLVYFTPATLDFIWLDSSGRRFEVAYDSDGHRQSLPRRPYLLDELKTLETIWQTLTGHLTTTQIHALNSLIENKREEWTADNGVFRQFCRDVLANAEWQSHPWEKDREGWLDTWADYAVRGWIADAVELHHHVMKQR